MRDDPLRRAAELRARGEPFALATVVARARPQAARAGARAVITPDGRVDGFLGGGCVTTVVKKEALAALEEGRPRLVTIGADEAGDAGWRERRVYPMTCRGEGRVEVYVEPFATSAALVVLGGGAVADALVRMAGLVGFRVVVHRRFAPDALAEGADLVVGEDEALETAIGADDYVVVATMGEGDEAALEMAAAPRPGWVSLVASPTKGARLLEDLAERGIDASFLEAVKYPAGLDLGGTEPGEIALSILAELVRVRAERPAASTSSAAATGSPTFATDPVCGMSVEVEEARHTAEWRGRTWYFCCPGCRRSFEEEPEAFVDAG
ncbi:MAG TPA: XdhC family protein [Longimicrobiales bacterium]|nr:XdhC family protein [Longimicrobiales bacterium]